MTRTADGFWGMPLWLGTLVAVLIIFVRGQVYYWIGRALGGRLPSSRLGRRIGEQRMRRVEDLVRRRGAVAVFGSHWVAGLRHAIPLTAGAVRMSYAWYIGATAAGAALWTPPWVIGGYAVVWGWLRVGARSWLVAAAIALLALAVTTTLIARRRRAAREPEHRRPATEGTAPAAETTETTRYSGEDSTSPSQ